MVWRCCWQRHSCGHEDCERWPRVLGSVGPDYGKACARCEDKRREVCAGQSVMVVSSVREGPSGQRSDRRGAQAGRCLLSQKKEEANRRNKGEPTKSMCSSLRHLVRLGTASSKTAELPFHLSSAGLLAVFGGLVVLCRHYVWSRVAGTVCGQ